MSHDPRSFGKVAVLLGGHSAEREVSLMSGRGVLAALRARGVDAHPFDPAERSLAELAAERFDRAFIALHGRLGEDGAIQGVLELLRIPYTGSGVLASATAMNKLAAKRIWRCEGLPTPDWWPVHADTDWQRLVAKLGNELIVKPAREGSTLGITKVIAHGNNELARAFEEALKYDELVFVEQLIRGRELTCAILGEGRSARALPLIEIRAPAENYDYHHKYFSDDTQYLCPAPLPPALAADIQALCVRAYNALGARGWGRVDVMLQVDAGGARPYLLELNTAPGMTSHSLVPMAARAAGLSYEDLVLEILAHAALETRA
ncbi:MAG: D-alanine--D-alanine ligase [Sutterellaceae bacterium]|nr:D-alanine--D-alanine ligase [Burkholderiaceae bacterium]MDW8429367.1 D-alanine--D-alanine ligase [Sutterellaceae bacterium]